jgi:hypothetical protein
MRGSVQFPTGTGAVEAAAIDAPFDAVHTTVRQRDGVLASRLLPLVERRVPARSVEAAPDLGAARLRFADGTTVLVRGSVPGDHARLAGAVRQRSVPLEAFRTDGDQTCLVFDWPGRRRTLSVLVTGLDQPEFHPTAAPSVCAG